MGQAGAPCCNSSSVNCSFVLKTDWSWRFSISVFSASSVISLPSSLSGDISWLSVFMCLMKAQNFLVGWGGSGVPSQILMGVHLSPVLFS